MSASTAEQVERDEPAEQPEEPRQTFILQTAGFDARFPNTNQTKHCWQSYVDYHKCVNKHGEEFAPCKHFFRAFHSLCPNRWIDRWDEQREAGKFPVCLDP